jgi:hypothetical protein
MDTGQTDWHRLFGLILTDFFTGSPFRVELEKDLSLKRQLLDVVVVRREEGPFSGQLPDGLEGLAAHNLITFKSYQEALDDWALKELTGHYVNYRKQVSPDRDNLLPEEQFRLYAVCARYPQGLAGQVALAPVQAGVYDCRRGTDLIRVVVLGQLPQAEHNAPLHLFSASQEQVRYGAEHYQQRSEDTSTLLQRLLERYRREGLSMPYTMEDFRRDYVKEHLKDLTPEEILAALFRKQGTQMPYTMEDFRRDFAKEFLKDLTPEERLAGLSPEERLAGLSPEEIAALLSRLRKDQPPPGPK